MLAALLRAGARFLVVGAHAMAAHGVPRATGDLGILVEPTPANAERVWQALLEFGAPVAALPLSTRDLEIPGQVVQIGVPPQRIDILTGVTGVEFETAWTERIVHRVDTLDLPFLGREALLRNKRATGRAKDVADVEILDRQQGRPCDLKRAREGPLVEVVGASRPRGESNLKDSRRPCGVTLDPD